MRCAAGEAPGAGEIGRKTNAIHTNRN
jgi:hypothetical protein